MKIMVIDGNSIVNRAFYGVRPLNAPDGTPTNAVYGFVSIVQKLIEDNAPDSLAVAFDVKAPTFRKEMFDGYKAQRKGMPEDLAVQMPILKELLDAMGIVRLECAGWEADDILGTIGRICEEKGDDCLVVTGDKDSFQLISEQVTVLHIKSRMGQTETIVYDVAKFVEEYGFEPKHMIDLKALMGDSSDNIPGVAGVGEKTAMTLIQKYKTIDYIYENIEEIEAKPAARKKLIEGMDMAKLSYTLATIDKNSPIEFDIAKTKFDGFHGDELHRMLKRLGFNKFIERWKLTETTEEQQEREEKLLERVDITSLDEIKSILEKAEYIAVSTNEDMSEIEVCDGDKVYYVNWSSLGDDYNILLKFIFSAEVKKISHEVKDLMSKLLNEGLALDGFIFDTALAAYVIDPTSANYDLTRLSEQYLGKSLDGVSAMFELYEKLDFALKSMDSDKLYYDMELPLCEVLATMEQTGFLVDKKALNEFSAALSEDIEVLQKEIYEQAGREFNINSPKQLGEILFVDLELPAGKKTKTGWSTNVDVLEKLRDKHPIINNVLEYRSLTKLKSTYADGLLKVIATDGRIHTNFKMTVTATGRLSSTEPNLQNIPVRTERGAMIRKMFVAAPQKMLIDADYSQIELRLLAHISDDETMKSAFINGEDIHAVTASQVFGIPLEEVTSLERSRAKAVNFGIVYGISAFSLAQDIGVWQSEAKAYIDAYLHKYHAVADYMKNVVIDAKEKGYVETLFGRKRPMPELKSSNFNTRSFGERVALNMPIQGTAADIIKLAMVAVFKRMKDEKLKARLILQVHDELIVEAPIDEVDIVKQILSEEMEKAASLSVKLVAEAAVGKTWSEAH